MKRCPTCGSISQDAESTCGVCGKDIARQVSESLEQMAPSHPPKEIIHKSSKLRNIAILTLGPALISIGLVTFFFNPVGLLILFAGIISLIPILGSGSRPMQGRRRMESGSTVTRDGTYAEDPLLQTRQILDAERGQSQPNYKKNHTKRED